MTTDALTAALAILSGPRDADGVSRSDDPRGMMVSPDELARRREIEGGNALIMCAGCGYGLAPADMICPKCGCGSREVATALVKRDHLPDLLAGHKEAEPQLSGKRAGHKSGLASASAAAARKKMMGNPALIAAHATGKGWESKEYRLAYMDVYNRKRWAETKAERKKEPK